MTEEVSLETRILKFFKEFRDEYDKLKYIEIITALPALEDKVVKIDFNDLFYHDRELAQELTEKPFDFIDAAKTAVIEVLKVERPLDVMHITKDSIYIAVSGEEPGYPVKLRSISSR